MRKAGFLLTLILLACTLVLSQAYKGKGKVKGLVYDEEGKPLEEVKVKLYSLKAQSGLKLLQMLMESGRLYGLEGGRGILTSRRLAISQKR